MKLARVALTLVPFLWTIGGIPFANRATPSPFGLPLLMVWIIAGTLVAFVCLMALYHIDTKHQKQ